MMARAEQWFQAQPRYDQDACYRVEGGYIRTDCLGFRVDELRTGDALLAWGRHVRLFDHWTNESRTTYVAYDFGATPVKHQEYTWNAPGEYDYVPIRYTPDR